MSERTSLEELEDVERTLTKALSAWAIGSIVTGGVISLLGRQREHADAMAFGRQTAVWGAVDGVIAGAGVISRRRRGVLSAEQMEKKTRALQRLLVINAVADVAYVAGGAVVMARSRHGRLLARLQAGDGAAIMVQGAFLLLLDVSQAARLRK